MASFAGAESLKTVRGEKSKLFLNHCPISEEEWTLAISLKDKSTVASVGAYSLIALCGPF
jgi:hypothetical protein